MARKKKVTKARLTKAAVRLAIEDEMEKIAQTQRTLDMRRSKAAAITYARLATQLAGMKLLAKRLGYRCDCKHIPCSCAYTRAGLIPARRFAGMSGLSFDGKHCRDAEGDFVPIDRCRGVRVTKKKKAAGR